MKNKDGLKIIWNLPNALSLLRIVLVIPIGYALSIQQNAVAIGLMLLAGVTDVLDGYFARNRDDITELGKIIDPLADKIAVTLIVLILLYQGRTPLWFVGVVILRDLLILLGGIWVQKKINYVLPSNYWGKATVIIICLTLIANIANASQEVIFYFYFVSVVAIIVSFLIYVQRGIKAVNDFNKQNIQSR